MFGFGKVSVGPISSLQKPFYSNEGPTVSPRSGESEAAPRRCGLSAQSGGHSVSHAHQSQQGEQRRGERGPAHEGPAQEGGDRRQGSTLGLCRVAGHRLREVEFRLDDRFFLLWGRIPPSARKGSTFAGTSSGSSPGTCRGTAMPSWTRCSTRLPGSSIIRNGRNSTARRQKSSARTFP